MSDRDGSALPSGANPSGLPGQTAAEVPLPASRSPTPAKGVDDFEDLYENMDINSQGGDEPTEAMNVDDEPTEAMNVDDEPTEAMNVDAVDGGDKEQSVDGGDKEQSVDGGDKEQSVDGDDYDYVAAAADPNAPRKPKDREVDMEEGGSDVDMDEAPPINTVETVTYTRGEMPPSVWEDVLKLDLELYPDTLDIGDVGPVDAPVSLTVDTKDLFAFRGMDINKRFIPTGLENGKRARTIVLLNDVGGDLIGHHLQDSLAEAKARDEEEPQDQPKKKQKGKAPAKPKEQPTPTPTPKEPPNNECVKAKFHLDTQTPHIEISTLDTDTNHVISTRIWASDITWLPEAPWCGFEVERVEASTQPVDGANAPAALQLVQTMASLDKTAVVVAKVQFLRANPNRVWEGISDAKLERIRGKELTPKSSVRDQLIHGLGTAHSISLFFSTKSSAGNLTKWTEKLHGYFRDLVMVAKYYGNFWWYRIQCELAGHGSDAIDKPEMPKPMKWITPRYLVTHWSVKKTTTPGGAVSFSKPYPDKWAPFEFPDSYPDVNEAAFLLKMAATQEMYTQRRRLNELLQSDGTKFFKARFTSLNRSRDMYSVEVYLGLTEQMAEANIKIPAPGTRIKLQVARKNHDRPTKKDMAHAEGQVVFDAVDTGATFCCVVNVVGKPLECADVGSDFPIFIEYVVDDLPFTRQINAIADLQRRDEKSMGPSAAKIIFNCKKPAKDTDIMKQQTTADQLIAFKNVLNTEFTFAPNAKQLAAAMNTCTSDTGTTVIVGPPGTGKTLTVEQIGIAHARIGHRVIFAAPTNSAVHTLVDEFLKHNASRPADVRVADHQWIYFTGAHSSVAKANKLRLQQGFSEEKDFMHRNQAYLAHLRDARSRDRAPRFTQTYGYKLEQRIGLWASDSKYDVLGGAQLYTLSRDFIKSREELPRAPTKALATKIKEHLTGLEATLGEAFMKDVVFCFCTLSASAHDALLESGIWDEVIIDEAARETRAGIATILGAFSGRMRHLTLSGDHMQGEGIIVGKDSNVGYKFLARNVFEEMADIDSKHPDNAQPSNAFELEESYRMSDALLWWSSKHCYGGRLKAHRSASLWNPALRNTLQAYWAQCTSADFKGTYEEIGLDINSPSEVQTGGTTRVNEGEAKLVAWRIKDMLAFDPPKPTKGVEYVRIRGTDFCIITSFVGQVTALRKYLREPFEGQKSITQDDIDGVQLLLGTTSWVQGKEAPIAFYTMVVSTGAVALPREEHLPIGFVAAIKNFNVSSTRQRLARYTVANYKLLSQMVIDRHRDTHTNAPFFDFIHYMKENQWILSEEESQRWIEKGERPEAADAFDRRLKNEVTFDREPMEPPVKKNESLLHGINTRAGSTNARLHKAPSGLKFSGNRDVKGNLAENKVTKKKHRGSKGAKHALKRDNRPGGGDDGAGSAGTTDGPVHPV